MISNKYLYLVFILLLQLTPFAAADVPGWATDHITMGTAVDGRVEQLDAIQQRPVEAIFTYAGINGGGDRGTYIEVDTKVKKIMEQVRALEKILKTSIHPVIVFYTVDASSSVWSMQQDLDIDPQTKTNNLFLHYANLIRLCLLLETYRDAQHPIPATLILNPDFIGELHKQCQQFYCPVPFDTKIKVQDGLINGMNMALKNKDQRPNIPLEFLKNDAALSDYFQSLNWVVKTFAPHVPFGWQDNVWAGDEKGHVWLHEAHGNPGQVQQHIQTEVAFLKQMRVVDAPYRPDFIAFDKWERDEFDSRLAGSKLKEGYLYNIDDWDIYMKYVSGISQNINNMPVMLWQIPGGHLQINGGDIDTRDDHASTAADYFLGDSELFIEQSRVRPYIAASVIDHKNYYVSSDSVLDYLQCHDNSKIKNTSNNSDCWHQYRLTSPAMKNVFAILWGGGSTTGIIKYSEDLEDSGWLYHNLHLRESPTHK